QVEALPDSLHRDWAQLRDRLQPVNDVPHVAACVIDHRQDGIVLELDTFRAQNHLRTSEDLFSLDLPYLVDFAARLDRVPDLPVLRCAEQDDHSIVFNRLEQYVLSIPAHSMRLVEQVDALFCPREVV